MTVGGSGSLHEPAATLQLKLDPDSGLPQNNLGGLETRAIRRGRRRLRHGSRTPAAPRSRSARSTPTTRSASSRLARSARGLRPGSPIVLQPGASVSFNAAFDAQERRPATRADPYRVQRSGSPGVRAEDRRHGPSRRPGAEVARRQFRAADEARRRVPSGTRHRRERPVQLRAAGQSGV